MVSIHHVAESNHSRQTVQVLALEYWVVVAITRDMNTQAKAFSHDLPILGVACMVC